MKTVADLRKLLDGLPDSMPLAVESSEAGKFFQPELPFVHTTTWAEVLKGGGFTAGQQLLVLYVED